MPGGRFIDATPHPAKITLPVLRTGVNVYVNGVFTNASDIAFGLFRSCSVRFVTLTVNAWDADDALLVTCRVNV
jgi:hypothetical protein